MTILVLIGTVFISIWEMFHGRISLNLMLLLLLVNFLSRISLELIYISPIQNIRSTLTRLHGFSAACRAATVHRNHFFHLYEKDRSSDSKVKFRQVSNHCKRVLEAAKLAYANPLPPRNLALMTFGKLLIVFSTKVNMLYLLYSTAQLFAENLSKNRNLDD